MEISVSSYSFYDDIKKGRLTQLSCIDKAHEIGLKNIEFIDLCPTDGISEEGYAKQLRSRADALGMKITAHTVSANLLSGDEKKDREECERLKRKAEIAALLGAPLLRHDVAFALPDIYRTFDAAVPYAAERILEITQYAEKLGVKTMTENHGFVFQDSYRVERLVTAVNHKNFGLLVDMGNFMCADEDSACAVSRCAPYAFYVHAKDFDFTPFGKGESKEGAIITRGANLLRGTAVGQGSVPVERCIAILKRANYDGVVSIEYEGSGDCTEGIKSGFDFLRKII